MTTLDRISCECPACRTELERVRVTSTYIGGPPDLDLRNAPMGRDLHRFEVAVCDSCGFPSLEEDDSSDPDVGRMVAAVSAASTEDFCHLEESRGLELRARLEERVGRHLVAGQHYLRAAWVADDEESDNAARLLRLDAVRVWTQLDRIGQVPAQDRPSSAVLVSDLLRRAGELTRAREVAEEGLEIRAESLVESLLHFELKLIEAGDRGPHSVAEVEIE